MIELIDVSKTYGKSTVVSGVTANFQKGKITGIVGRNGSGKSTADECKTGNIGQENSSYRNSRTYHFVDPYVFA